MYTLSGYGVFFSPKFRQKSPLRIVSTYEIELYCSTNNGIAFVVFNRTELANDIQYEGDGNSVIFRLTTAYENLPLLLDIPIIPNGSAELCEGDSVVIVTTEHYAVGDRVKICQGSMEGLEGELIRIGNSHRLVIRLQHLGCAMVEVEVSDVEKVSG